MQYQREPKRNQSKQKRKHVRTVAIRRGAAVLAVFVMLFVTFALAVPPDASGAQDSGEVTTISFEGAGYSVTAAFLPEADLAGDAELCVTEIHRDGEAEETTEYQAYYEQTEEVLADEDISADEISSARFFDISFVRDGQEIEPTGDVEIVISTEEEPEGDVLAVHLPDGKAGEVLDAAVDGDDVSFTADSFSVYGIVYTVDFSCDLDGESYDYSMAGGSYTTLGRLAAALGIGPADTERFLGEVKDVTFSAPELMLVAYAETDTTVGAIKDANGAGQVLSADVSQEEAKQADQDIVAAGDWALISLQPFDTEETLIVTMKNGDVFTIAVTDAQNTDVTYSVSTKKDTDVAGNALTVNVQAAVPSGTGSLLFPSRYVYVLLDQTNASCAELQGVAAGGTTVVKDSSGMDVMLHMENDGFWFELDARNGETVDIPLHFNSEETANESDPKSVNLYAGAGVRALGLGTVLSARGDALRNQNLARYGWADSSTYVNLSWTQEEVDPEPVMTDEFTVSADEVYGYFDARLNADFHAQAGRGSDNNVFYVRQSADRSELAILKDAQAGDVVPAVDNAGKPVTDRYGTQLMLHVTENGFWFELDNTKHNNYADFTLAYKATDDATQNVSNAAKMRLYLAQDQDADSAANAAAQKFSPNLSLTWSDTGDKMQYAISLIWDTSIEKDKYDQEVVTTSQAILEPKYKLELQTTSANYEAEQFRIELPYALWMYRGSTNGTSCPVPTDLSIPKEGTALNGNKFHYHIEYDAEYPKDLTKAKLVITNAEYLPAGTNATISVKYTVDPWKTVDLSAAELTAMVSAQATNQAVPELGESNTITYKLDTGFDSCFIKKTSTWTSMEAAAVYARPDYLQDEYWDPDNYNMVRFHINYGANGYNQPLDLDFLASLPEGAELVMVKPHVGNGRPIPVDTEEGTWERSITSKSTSSSDGDYWFYVRFPRTGDGDADYHVRLDMDVTAQDDDSHTPPEDYNDKGHQYLEWDFHWTDYEFKPTGTESYSKMGWGDDYIEAVKAGNTDVEFDWRMYVTTNRWYLEEGETQYIRMTDDAHFWKYVPSSYSTNDWRKASDMQWMDADSWEFSKITSISFQYYDLSHRDGTNTYPDFPGGTLTIQASKDGKTWDDIRTISVPAMTGRSSAGISIPGSGAYEFAKGSGYTRLRVISPEVGRGSLNMEVNFYTRMKGSSALVQQWLEECPEGQKVYVRNYAAYQHFTRQYQTETVTDPETGEVTTKKTDQLGGYVWDDALSQNPFSYAARDGVSDGMSLADRDVKDNQYVSDEPGGYVRRAYANGQLRHFVYGAHMEKFTGETINDSANQRAVVPFTLREEEILTGKSGNQYTEIFREFSQDSGTFYDLLSPGYRYLEGTADGQSATGLDAPVTVETIDDFRGSGRQMVIFHITKQADPEGYTTSVDTNLKNQGYSGYIFGKTKETQYKSNYTGNPHTGFLITFQAYIPWKNLVDHPSETNLVSFQRTDDQPIRGGQSDQGYPNRQSGFSTDSQIIKEFKGTAATSRKIDYDKETTAAFDAAFAAAGGVRASGPGIFTDVDGDGVITNRSSLYAYSTANPQVVDGVQTEISKEVLGDQGKAKIAANTGDGWSKLDRTTLEGSYSYRITAKASMGIMRGLIIYDTLEDAKNKEGARDEVTWEGSFDSVDVSDAVDKGFAPVVYYATAALDYNTITGNEKYIWIDDDTIWSTTCPADKSRVTAIAVDLRRMADGSEAILQSKSGADDPDVDAVSVIVNMTAPDKYPVDPKMVYAINRPAYSCYQKGFFSAEEIHKTDIGLRVKIALPVVVRVQKTSLGAKTPAATGFTLTCPNGYQYRFTYSDFDENGIFTFDDAVLQAAPDADDNGTPKPEAVSAGEYAVQEDEDSAAVFGEKPKVTYQEAGGRIDTHGTDGVLHIINDYRSEQGHSLPATGGAGTGCIRLLGGILVLFAGAFWIYRRRNRTE